MTPTPKTMSSKKTAIDALQLMWEGGFRHLPVVENKRVVGMISIGDLVKAMISEQQILIEQLQHYISG